MSIARIISNTTATEQTETKTETEETLQNTECLELLRTISEDLKCIKEMLCTDRNQDTADAVITLSERK